VSIDLAHLIVIFAFCADAGAIGCLNYCLRDFPLAVQRPGDHMTAGRELEDQRRLAARKEEFS
jgi:hypothetical protein